jgi:phosphoribosylcarboxyaminoimidazole (NCAIR) mutase
MARALIVIGSKSDREFADICQTQLAEFGIEGTIEVSSAHRHPHKTAELAGKAQENGFEVIIAMAGLSAALPGVMAAHSSLPVIGVPQPWVGWMLCCRSSRCLPEFRWPLWLSGRRAQKTRLFWQPGFWR